MCIYIYTERERESCTFSSAVCMQQISCVYKEHADVLIHISHGQKLFIKGILYRVYAITHKGLLLGYVMDDSRATLRMDIGFCAGHCIRCPPRVRI